MGLLFWTKTGDVSFSFVKVTSVSKKLGQSAVVLHYCALSQFFWNRRYNVGNGIISSASHQLIWLWRVRKYLFKFSTAQDWRKRLCLLNKKRIKKSKQIPFNIHHSDFVIIKSMIRFQSHVKNSDRISSWFRLTRLQDSGIHIFVMIPVLYTVGLQATFWNMNSSVWAVWAAMAVRKKKWIFWATFEVGFFNFLWAKQQLKICLKIL